MAVCPFKDKIGQLYNEYSDRTYGDQACVIHFDSPVVNRGFIGSENIVYITSSDSISQQTPACIGAKLVNMVASRAIELGVNETSQIPVRLYVPVSLTITTKHLSIGNLSFIQEPEQAFLSCKKLTLKKPFLDNEEACELLQSWVISDETEVEKILYESSLPEFSPLPSEQFDRPLEEERITLGSWPAQSSSLIAKETKSRPLFREAPF